MTLAISLSSTTRAALDSLGDLNRQIARAQLRLASGKRVANPSDDAAAYFTAANLSTRAASLTTLLEGLDAGRNTFEAADAGLKAVEDLIRSAQSLANQAAASPNTLVKVTGTNSTPYTTASVIATSSGSSTRLKGGDTITVGDGTNTVTYTAANNDTVQTFLNAVNNAANLKVTASLNSSGQIQLQATGANDVTISANVSSSSGLTGATGLSAGTTAFTPNATRQSLAQQFDSLLTQIDAAFGDASYNGVNLLTGGSLSLSFNESGSSKLSHTGVSLSSASLGITAATGGFQLDSEINSTLSSLTSALTGLQTHASVLTSTTATLDARRTFMSSMTELLSTGADELVVADPDEDSVLLAALQSRQQLATLALSLSGQREQNALKLFGLA